MANKQPKKSNNINHAHGSSAHKIATGGIFAALSLSIMLLGCFLPVATFAAPMLAGLFLIPVAHEVGRKTAFLAFFAVGLLSFFVVPEKEMAMFFFFLMGYYPIIQPCFAKLKLLIIRLLLKLLLFNSSVAFIYFILLKVFTSSALRAEFAEYSNRFLIFMLILGNICFLIYDVLVTWLRNIYVTRFRKKLK